MGVNICIQKLDGTDHPKWDWSRYAGDREFASYLWTAAMPYVEKVIDELSYIRPTDFAAWRAALPAQRDNPDRLPQMLDILEREPDYWLYFSW